MTLKLFEILFKFLFCFCFRTTTRTVSTSGWTSPNATSPRLRKAQTSTTSKSRTEKTPKRRKNKVRKKNDQKNIENWEPEAKLIYLNAPKVESQNEKWSKKCWFLEPTNSFFNSELIFGQPHKILKCIYNLNCSFII